MVAHTHDKLLKFKRIKRMCWLTRAGPGRLKKSFWSCSWYFCVSWNSAETCCCCRPEAQTLDSSWIFSKLYKTSVWRSPCVNVIRHCKHVLAWLNWRCEVKQSSTEISNVAPAQAGTLSLSYWSSHTLNDILKGQHQETSHSFGCLKSPRTSNEIRVCFFTSWVRLLDLARGGGRECDEIIEQR